MKIKITFAYGGGQWSDKVRTPYFIGALLLFFNAATFAQTNTFPASGNVGINNTSPSELLTIGNSGTPWANEQVAFSVRDNSSNGYSLAYLPYGNTPGGTGAKMIIGWGLDPNVYEATFDLGNYANIGRDTGGGIFFSTRPNGHFEKRMQIRRNGNVGIGTLIPSEKLQVDGTIYSSAGGFKFPDGSIQTTAVNSGSQWTTSGSNIYYNTGNVGIGTTTPTSKLEVTGNIAATSATIDGITIGTNRITSTTNNLSFDGNNVTTTGNFSATNITATGNIGIGTSQPSEKLEVIGNVRVSGKIITPKITSPDSVIRFGDSTLYINYNTPQLYVLGAGTYKGIGIGNNSFAKGQNAVAMGFRALATGFRSIAIGSFCEVPQNVSNAIAIGNNFINSNPNSVMIGFSATAPAFYTDQTGNVGIGTTNPQRKLHVFGKGKFEDGNGNGVNIGFNSVNSFLYSEGTGALMINYHSNNPVVIGNGSSGTTLKIDGHVGISTSPDPLYNLKINAANNLDKAFAVFNGSNENFLVYGDGFCFAKRFEVAVGAFVHPDYVFENDYSLMSIAELKNFIDKNKHLPNFLSAKQYEKKGKYDLLEMDMNLLKTSEELTLYVIEMKKMINDQNEVIDEMKKEITKLKNK